MRKKQVAETTPLLPRMFKGRFSAALSHDGSPFITRILLTATIIAVVLLLLLLCVSYFVLGNQHVAPRLFLSVGVIAYLGLIEWLFRKKKLHLAAQLLIVFYLFLSTIVLIGWGLNAPIGILTLGFVILLAGIMLGARFILPYTAVVIVSLLAIQYLGAIEVIRPDTSSLSNPSTYIDVASYTVIFGVFALVSWLSGRQMEYALRRALKAESALQQEKDSLADRLKEQTLKLRESQLAEMNQLYRFAELGQLSTVTMHELANHLNTLALDLDDIEKRHHSSNALNRAKESLSYLDSMITEVRQRIYEEAPPYEFELGRLIKDMAPLFEKLTHRRQVVIQYIPTPTKGSVKVIGDPLRLAQVLKVLVTNAIEAYDSSPIDERRVAIEIKKQASKVKISVTDWGVGIPAKRRSRIFSPFQSTKPNGMGVGLFIAKKMVESHFKGNLMLSPTKDRTEFVIELPVVTQRRKRS